MYGANAAMPLLVLKAAELAGVAHFVHVSSAAVQGRRDPLDESATTAPFSEYSRSKALGEQLLAEHQSPIALTLYRPTSVMASGRGITRALLMATQLPAIPLIGAGDRPLPVAHLDNVAAAVVHLVRTRRTGIALHPWEGFDLRTLLIALGGDQRRFVHLPQALGRVTEVAVRTPSARLRAIGRRFELLVHGQGQQARVLVDAGFVAPCGREEYARLAESAGSSWRRSSPI
jgi:nucleoside-diphosphate-sugar epimerase